MKEIAVSVTKYTVWCKPVEVKDKEILVYDGLGADGKPVGEPKRYYNEVYDLKKTAPPKRDISSMFDKICSPVKEVKNVTFENGVESIIVLERAETLGGILEQCIHTGFGLHYFGEELSFDIVYRSAEVSCIKIFPDFRFLV